MLKRFIVSAFALAVLSCSDPTKAPDVESHMYVLRSVAGEALPATVVIGDATDWAILADTMRFRDDGTGDEVLIWRTTTVGQPPGPPERVERSFAYRTNDGKLELEFPCPDFPAGNTASCIAPPHYRGLIGQREIQFSFALSYPTPLRFEKVD